MVDPPRSAKKPVVQARALATRAKILQQAEIAFARHGFDAASLTSDILAPAGVSVGSFYHQFDNKADVLFAMLDERLAGRRERVVELLEASSELSFADSICIAIEALLDDMEASPDAWRVQYRERQHPNPAISDAIEIGWSAWAKVSCALVERCFDATPERADAAAHATVLVAAGLLRDYLAADDERRAVLRARVPTVAEFCAAGAERIVASS